jgi:hypothetical protein
MMRRWRIIAPAAALLALAACSTGEGGEGGGADTSSVPGPAEIDRSETQGFPDSTAGVAPENGTGRAGAAGDQMGRADPRTSVPADSIIQREQGGDTTRRTP